MFGDAVALQFTASLIARFIVFSQFDALSVPNRRSGQGNYEFIDGTLKAINKGKANRRHGILL